MKKFLKIFVLVALVAMLATTTVKATVNDDFLKELYKPRTVGGKDVVFTSEDRVRIERYLSEHELTEAQKNTVLEKFQAIVDILNSENVSAPAYLTRANRDKAIKLAEEGAAALNLKLVADTVPNTIKIYDANGKLIESMIIEKEKLIYTGNNAIVVVAPVVALIAVATFVVVRKKKNA